MLHAAFLHSTTTFTSKMSQMSTKVPPPPLYSDTKGDHLGDFGGDEKPHKPTTHRKVLFFLGLIVTAATYITFYHTPLEYLHLRSPCHKDTAPTSHFGWHSRAQRVHAGFHPSNDTVAFGDIYSALFDAEGFTAGFFSPDIVVDARAKVLKLDKGDWNGIVDLALKATKLPDTGEFRNQWRIRHPGYEYPIDWLRIKLADGSFKNIQVYGFDGWTDELEEPVGDYKTLPPILMELFGLLMEARDGYEPGIEDRHIISEVKDVLDLDEA